MTLERRKAERFKTRIETLFKDEEGLNFACITDISHGGFFLECGKPIPRNSKIRILAKSGNRSIALQGRVVHEPIQFTKRGVGVQFVELSFEEKAIRDDILISLMFKKHDSHQWS